MAEQRTLNPGQVNTFSRPNEQLLADFLSSRRNQGLSKHSVRFYEGYLHRWLAALDGSVLASEPAHISSFLGHLDCSQGGKHAYYRAIRAFYKWACEQDYIAASPTDKMKAPKVPKPLRHAVTLQDLDTLMVACDSVRDKLIVSMLADTGLRRSELANINVGDIDLGRQTIKVWGKGAKERIVCYGPRTHSLLLQWLQERPQGDRLFGLNEWGVGEMLERLERRTAIKCNAHAFRRTFATESVRNGLNLFHVQSLLGHANLTMTRVYAEQVNSEDAIKAYKPIVT